MADRDERREQAKKHLALMKGALASDAEKSVANATIYEDGEALKAELPEAPFETTETMVVTSFAPEALYRNGKGKTAIVDPASFNRPGGAYEDGAFGPEQILCADSNLYLVLQGMRERYYDANKGYARGQLFTDRAMYLPDVAFSRNGALKYADIIAIAEPLLERALENHRPQQECDKAIVDRIETLLRIAAINEVETLIMGAFGTGRLGYPVDKVIEIIRGWVDANPGAIGRIVFAVPRMYVEAFDEAFGAEAAQPEPDPEAEGEGEEEDDEYFDVHDIELPEGITLR